MTVKAYNRYTKLLSSSQKDFLLNVFMISTYVIQRDLGGKCYKCVIIIYSLVVNINNKLFSRLIRILLISFVLNFCPEIVSVLCIMIVM